ncbi:hypothetical protein KFL_000550240 [Klebsormidium nitens]|uniref:Uncharacterized protein n=1 Tax=Klebsormidium nitens TaxID=105231 RepID=A0A1Y1HPD2_KLENI|nr:hypothetical protein KFL_000550240 [Klebsormidium nitens]|eukprot:GAQ80494.1 hypothetical protein KFL_000550240 [Klebsormidium nitens]
MTVFGPSQDLRSRETFNSIAYDPLTKTLWICMGSTLALYDLSDPSNPAPGPKLSPKGFLPFVSGVAFDVPGRSAFYVSQDANRSGGKVQVLKVNLDTHVWSFVDLGPADTTTSDYMSVVMEGSAQYLYVAACSYSSWNASSGKTSFAARLEVASGSVSWLQSSFNQTFRGVSVDDRDGLVYLLTNDPSKPIYAGAISEELSVSTMTTMVIAYDTANRPGTAYAGVFAKSSSTDLAFFLHDATDGISSGVDILSFSTGGCKRLYAPCLNFDGTCGCLTSTLFNSIAPVSKCSTNVTDDQPQFTLSSCSAIPPTVALPPKLMPASPTATPTPELTPSPTDPSPPPPNGANTSDVGAQTSGGAAGSGKTLSASIVLSGILIAAASMV